MLNSEWRDLVAATKEPAQSSSAMHRFRHQWQLDSHTMLLFAALRGIIWVAFSANEPQFSNQ